jgi:hypothetical protein
MNSYIKFEMLPCDMAIGNLFVNHEKNNRSGHLSHALAEYKKDSVIAFYSNCSGKRNKWAPGHNGFGWLEYKRSQDGGFTWDEAKIFPYSWESFLNEPFTVSCEKAVSTQENEIVALCIRNENPNGWEPYLEPVVVRSEDGGETWSDAVLLGDKKGRIYDAIVQDGDIYVLMLANNDFLAVKPEHRYYIYKSEDHGKSFFLQGELPERALVLGTGGASKAVQQALHRLKIPYEVVSRDPLRGDYTYETLRERGLAPYPLVVNATPIGTYPAVEEAPALPYPTLTPDHRLFDLVYNPPVTAFLAEGRARGARTLNGEPMLLCQAEASWRIWGLL